MSLDLLFRGLHLASGLLWGTLVVVQMRSPSARWVGPAWGTLTMAVATGFLVPAAGRWPYGMALTLKQLLVLGSLLAVTALQFPPEIERVSNRLYLPLRGHRALSGLNLALTTSILALSLVLYLLAV